MRYLLLIYTDEKSVGSMSQEERASWMDSWFKYHGELERAVKVQAGEALQPTATATTVRVKDGRTLTTDGPFAETKEQLGGFYLIHARDLDEAIEWAAKMPNLPVGGSVEVRPVVEFDTPQP